MARPRADPVRGVLAAAGRAAGRCAVSSEDLAALRRVSRRFVANWRRCACTSGGGGDRLDTPPRRPSPGSRRWRTRVMSIVTITDPPLRRPRHARRAPRDSEPRSPRRWTCIDHRGAANRVAAHRARVGQSSFCQAEAPMHGARLNDACMPYRQAIRGSSPTRCHHCRRWRGQSYEDCFWPF